MLRARYSLTSYYSFCEEKFLSTNALAPFHGVTTMFY